MVKHGNCLAASAGRAHRGARGGAREPRLAPPRATSGYIGTPRLESTCPVSPNPQQCNRESKRSTLQGRARCSESAQNLQQGCPKGGGLKASSSCKDPKKPLHPAVCVQEFPSAFPADLNDVPFTLELSFVNGGQPRHFTGGAFEGSKFSLQRTSPSAGAGAPGDIEWCPNQNYFLVTAYGVTNTLVYTPSCDHSWSVSPPRACPVHCPCVALSHCPCLPHGLPAATGLVTGSGLLATPTATPAATGPGCQPPPPLPPPPLPGLPLPLPLPGLTPRPRGGGGNQDAGGKSHEWRPREGRPNDRLYTPCVLVSCCACLVVLVLLCVSCCVCRMCVCVRMPRLGVLSSRVLCVVFLVCARM